MTKRIRDLIYFDFNKAASLWSQFDDGLLKEEHARNQNIVKADAKAKLRIPILSDISGEAGLERSRDTLRVKALHHNLLTELEAELRNSNLLRDLTVDLPQETDDSDAISQSLIELPYLLASGFSKFQDYDRLCSVMSHFNDLGTLVAKSMERTLQSSAEYQQVVQSLEQVKTAIAVERDKNKRAEARRHLAETEAALRFQKPDGLSVEKWLVDGTQLWTKIFMPRGVVLKLTPFPRCPNFKLECILKRSCFVDDDLDSVLHAYSSAPNIRLGVLGLVTSVPTDDASSSGSSPTARNEPTLMASAFDQLFIALEGLEAFNQTNEYHAARVQPIAVFRDF